jgi:MraZ protein
MLFARAIAADSKAVAFSPTTLRSGMIQMFIGQYHHAINDKSRLTIPAGFRELLLGGAFVTQGFDRNLWVLTAEAFQEIYQRVMAMNLADPLARLLLRMILGTASELEMDEAGCILVPQNLREYANLDGEAILVGQGDYFEVWAPAHWHEQEAQLQDAEANAQRFVMLNLAVG